MLEGETINIDEVQLSEETSEVSVELQIKKKGKSNKRRRKDEIIVLEVDTSKSYMVHIPKLLNEYEKNRLKEGLLDDTSEDSEAERNSSEVGDGDNLNNNETNYEDEGEGESINSITTEGDEDENEEDITVNNFFGNILKRANNDESHDVGDYDFEDDFIDDSELLFPKQEKEPKKKRVIVLNDEGNIQDEEAGFDENQFFVYYGPISKKEDEINVTSEPEVTSGKRKTATIKNITNKESEKSKPIRDALARRGRPRNSDRPVGINTGAMVIMSSSEKPKVIIDKSTRAKVDNNQIVDQVNVDSDTSLTTLEESGNDDESSDSNNPESLETSNPKENRFGPEVSEASLNEIGDKKIINRFKLPDWVKEGTSAPQFKSGMDNLFKKAEDIFSKDTSSGSSQISLRLRNQLSFIAFIFIHFEQRMYGNLSLNLTDRFCMLLSKDVNFVHTLVGKMTLYSRYTYLNICFNNKFKSIAKNIEEFYKKVDETADPKEIPKFVWKQEFKIPLFELVQIQRCIFIISNEMLVEAGENPEFEYSENKGRSHLWKSIVKLFPEGQMTTQKVSGIYSKFKASKQKDDIPISNLLAYPFKFLLNKQHSNQLDIGSEVTLPNNKEDNDDKLPNEPKIPISPQKNMVIKEETQSDLNESKPKKVAVRKKISNPSSINGAEATKKYLSQSLIHESSHESSSTIFRSKEINSHKESMINKRYERKIKGVITQRNHEGGSDKSQNDLNTIKSNGKGQESSSLIQNKNSESKMSANVKKIGLKLSTGKFTTALKPIANRHDQSFGAPNKSIVTKKRAEKDSVRTERESQSQIITLKDVNKSRPSNYLQTKVQQHNMHHESKDNRDTYSITEPISLDSSPDLEVNFKSNVKKASSNIKVRRERNEGHNRTLSSRLNHTSISNDNRCSPVLNQHNAINSEYYDSSIRRGTISNDPVLNYNEYERIDYQQSTLCRHNNDNLNNSINDRYAQNPTYPAYSIPHNAGINQPHPYLASHHANHFYDEQNQSPLSNNRSDNGSNNPYGYYYDSNPNPPPY